jgi:hypothetical protein
MAHAGPRHMRSDARNARDRPVLKVESVVAKVGLSELRAADRAAIIAAKDVESGSVAGHRYATEVSDGGTGRALAGHGELRPYASTVTIPEGTTLTVRTKDGHTITNSTGLLIEAAEYDNYTLKAPDGLRILATLVLSRMLPSCTAFSSQGHIDWAVCLRWITGYIES